jgi:DHA1 family tetracycline resistance protein-like MFS transporter
MRLLIWIYFLLYLAGQVHPSIWTLYTQYKFNWSAFEVGLSLSFVGVSVAFTQGYLTRIVIPKWGEQKSLYIGMFFYIAGFAAFAFANQGWMMYVIMAATTLSGITGPASQSIISAGVPPQEQGELQGTLMSMASLTAIIGPLLYTDVFARFTSPESPFQFSGVSYLMAALISVLALVLFMFYKARNKSAAL